MTPIMLKGSARILKGMLKNLTSSTVMLISAAHKHPSHYLAVLLSRSMNW